MATMHDLTTSAYLGAYGKSVTSHASEVRKKSRYVNCATANQASGEYYQLFYVPANSLVETWMVTETVEGAAETADLSFVAATDTTAASPTSLVANHDLNTDNTMNAGTVIWTAVAGYICVKPDAALTVCKYWVAMRTQALATTD